MANPDSERIAREWQAKLNGDPERQAKFEAWGHLTHAIAYLSGECPHGAKNTVEAFKEIQNCIWVLKAQVLERDDCMARDALISLTLERDRLEEWKASASQVLDGVNLQEVGKALNLSLGSDIGIAILPGIQKLTRERDTALAERDRLRKGEFNAFVKQ